MIHFIPFPGYYILLYVTIAPRSTKKGIATLFPWVGIIRWASYGLLMLWFIVGVMTFIAIGLYSAQLPDYMLKRSPKSECVTLYNTAFQNTMNQPGAFSYLNVHLRINLLYWNNLLYFLISLL